MIVSFFQKRISLLVLLLLALVVWYQPLFLDSGMHAVANSPLGGLFSKCEVSNLLYNRVTFVLLILFAILVTSLNALSSLQGEKLFFGMFIFIIVSGYEIPIIQAHGGFLILILLIFSNFIIIHKQGLVTVQQSFNAGLIFAFSSLISPLLLLLIPVLLVAIVSQKTRSYKVYVTFIFGLIAVWIIFATCALMMNASRVVSNLYLSFNNPERLIGAEFYLYTPSILFLLWSVVAILIKGRYMKKDVLRYYESNMIQGLYCFVVMLVFPQTLSITLPLTIIFFSLLINHQANTLEGKVTPWIAIAYLLVSFAMPYFVNYSAYYIM